MMNKLLNKKWTASLLFGLAMTLNALAGQAPHAVSRAALDFDHEAALVRWAFNDASTCEQVTSVTPADAFKVLSEDKQEIEIRELEDDIYATESEFKDELGPMIPPEAMTEEEEAVVEDFDFDDLDLGDDDFNLNDGDFE